MCLLLSNHYPLIRLKTKFLSECYDNTRDWHTKMAGNLADKYYSFHDIPQIVPFEIFQASKTLPDYIYQL